MVKKGDFLKIEYTGYDQNGNVFDSTSGEIGKEMHGKEGPLLVVMDFDYLVEGMRQALLQMNKGDEQEISIPPELAFGERQRVRLKVLPLSDFHDNETEPYPGAVIRMDTPGGGISGLVKSVNSGRVLVDFNHPLSGQTVRYKLKLVDVILDPAQKVSELLSDTDSKGTAVLEGETATITLNKGQEDEKMKKTQLQIAITKAIPEVKEVLFKEE